MFGLELKIVDGSAIDRATERRQHDDLEAEERADEDARDDAAQYFMQSYRGMRFTIGAVAFALPWLLIVVDLKLLSGTPQIRGSMSAYYHSSARDIFVGGLIATGGFMVSYMTGKMRTYDYWLSSLAGILIIVVAFFPTGRELRLTNFDVSSDSCENFPGPPYCTGLQSAWHENTVRFIHGFCASLFVATLVLLCVVFALREFGYGPAAEELCGRQRNVGAVRQKLRERQVGLWTYVLHGISNGNKPAPRRRTLLYVASTVTMLLAIVWKFLGIDLAVPFTPYSLAPLYVTEFVSFNAFGVAWVASSWDMKVFRKVERGARVITRRKGAGDQRDERLTPPPQPAV